MGLALMYCTMLCTVRTLLIAIQAFEVLLSRLCSRAGKQKKNRGRDQRFGVAGMQAEKGPGHVDTLDGRTKDP